LSVPGLDLTGARIVWEARDQEPAYGDSFLIVPKSNGPHWVEAEAQFPDGRRIVASANFVADNPVVTWVDDSIPAGGTMATLGGDTWNWTTSNPSPISGAVAHQSAIVAGEHQHWFENASSTMVVKTGDVMFAYIYLDPANPPSEVMLQWNDGSWEHRAYWGANKILYGNDGTGGRRYMGGLPALGQWVRLEVPASQVNLEGITVKGMSFTLYGGRATWDASGKTSPGALASAITPTVAMTSGAAAVSFNSTPGSNYQVAYASTVNSTNWTALGTPVTATGSVTTVKDVTPATNMQRYYKVLPK
jgi:hypothetical protein